MGKIKGTPEAIAAAEARHKIENLELLEKYNAILDETHPVFMEINNHGYTKENPQARAFNKNDEEKTYEICARWFILEQELCRKYTAYRNGHWNQTAESKRIADAILAISCLQDEAHSLLWCYDLRSPIKSGAISTLPEAERIAFEEREREEKVTDEDEAEHTES